MSKRPLPLYDFSAFGAAIKAARNERGESRNINQIAKRVNSTSDIYREDIAELRERLGEIWRLQKRILSVLH